MILKVKYERLYKTITNMINEKFKAIRKRKGITQTKLSKDTGIGRSTIWRFESNKCDIKLSTLNILVQYIGGILSIDEYLEFQGKEPEYIKSDPDCWRKLDDELNKYSEKEQKYILKSIINNFALSD